MTSFLLKAPGQGAETGLELDPPTPFHRLETKSLGERRQEGTEALGLVPGLNSHPLDGGARQIVGKLLGQTSCDWIPALPLTAVYLKHSISFSGPKFSYLTSPFLAVVSLGIIDQGQGLRPACLKPKCPPTDLRG